MKTFSSTVLKNSAFGLAAQFIIKVLSFAFSVLIIRRLGASSFGQYSAILAFIATFSIFSDLGLAPYSVRQVARWRDDPDGQEKTNALYADVFTLRIGLSALTVIALVVVAFATQRPPLMIGAIALSSLSLFLYAIQGASDSVLSGLERLDLSNGSKVLNQLVFVVVGAITLIIGWGYFGLIIANLLGVSIMTIATWRMVHLQGYHLGKRVGKNWGKLLKASLPFGIIGLALGLSYKYDSVLLNIFRGDAETGFYNAAYNLVFSVLVISNTINTAIYPSLSRQVISQPQGLPKIAERAFGYLLLLSLPIAVAVSLLADKLIIFLYTSAYSPVIPALRIIIWVVPFMFASEFLGYVVVITDRESRVARAVMVSTGLNILVNSLLVPRFGYIAAAVMTVMTEIILVGQHTWTLRAMMRSFDGRKIILKPVLALMGMAVGIYFLRDQVHLLIVMAVGGAIYTGLLVLLGVIRKDDFLFFLRARSQEIPVVPTTPVID